MLTRVLDILPPAIAVLWVAGIARFRNLELPLWAWPALLAAAFALQIVATRLRGPERRIALPPGSNPRFIAFLAALITGVFALLVGFAVEATLPATDDAHTTPLALRAVWHGACAFAATYCRFLARLLRRTDAAPPAA